MEHRLSNLKNSLNNNVFNNFSFSEERCLAVKETIKIEANLNWDKVMIFLLLNTIHGRSVTGFEIFVSLQKKGNAMFNEQEGSLYTMLHRLEYKGLLCAKWKTNNHKNRKYYSLTSKGKLMVLLANTRKKNSSILFRGVLEGGPV